MTDVPPPALAPYPECVPVLTDGVVTLRAADPQDAERLVEQGSDPVTLRGTGIPRPYGLQNAQEFLTHIRDQWLLPDGARVWAVAVDGGDAPLPYAGTIELRPIAHGEAASIGFALHPAARGRGVMARAVRLACRQAFDAGIGSGPLPRVHWEAIRGNFASRRVAWACGFTMHATVPDHCWAPGEPALDAWLGSLGREDPMQPSVPWLVPPLLEGDGVRLRAWRDSDASVVEEPDHPEHFLPVAGVPTPDTFDEWLLRRRERMADGNAVFWCLADTDTDRALGGVLLFQRGAPLAAPSAELGYFLFPSARGRGAMARGVTLALRHAFTASPDGGLGLSRVSAVTAPDNEASNAVLRAAGFTHWGTAHAAYGNPDGSVSDDWHWELLVPGLEGDAGS